MDGLTSLLGGAIVPLLGDTSAPGVDPSAEWAIAEILGSAYGYSIGFTALPAVPPGPSGDITAWVRDGAVWVNRTDWLIYPLKRSAQVGSRSQLTVTLTDAGKATSTWRPRQFDDIQLYVGSYLFFSGYFDTTVEKRLPGTSFYMSTGTCLSYETRMDHIMMRRQLLLPDPVDPTITVVPVGTFVQLFVVDRMQTDIGIVMSTNLAIFGAPYFQHNETWDTVSVLNFCQGICDEFGYEMYLDPNLKLWFFDPAVGTGAAPFPIVDITDGAAPAIPLWQNLTVTNGGAAYCNRAYVRNNQQQKGVSGEDNPFTLAYVPYAENVAEVARVGPYEVVQSVKNQALQSMDAIAATGLIAFEIHQATLETFEIGFEPGQLLSVATTIPQLTDDLLIESVDSDLVGQFAGQSPFIADSGTLRFQHSVKASNAQMHRRQSGWRVWQGIESGINAPVDRTTYTPSWEIAISIPGSANPGVQVTDVFADIPALRDGICRQLTVGPFQVPPVTTDLIFDVLLNGTSILPASPGGITYPIGISNAVVTFTFRSDPEPVKGPFKAGDGSSQVVDKFSLVVLQGDAAAQDGIIAITVQG